MEEEYNKLEMLIQKLSLQDQLRLVEKALWSCRQKIKKEGNQDGE